MLHVHCYYNEMTCDGTKVKCTMEVPCKNSNEYVPFMLRIHWNFCVEVPCMEYLSLQASNNKEDYSTHGVIFLAACPEGQMYHAWKFHAKFPMNTYPYTLKLYVTEFPHRE